MPSSSSHLLKPYLVVRKQALLLTLHFYTNVGMNDGHILMHIGSSAVMDKHSGWKWKLGVCSVQLTPGVAAEGP